MIKVTSRVNASLKQMLIALLNYCTIYVSVSLLSGGTITLKTEYLQMLSINVFNFNYATCIWIKASFSTYFFPIYLN
jgi:hypothetical protein